MIEVLESGREAFAQHRWTDAYERLREADSESRLGPEDLASLAEAARWSRHYAEMLDAFERAEAAFSAAGDRRGAARMALQLAWEADQRGDDAVAGGWFGRATSHLEDEPECAEEALRLTIAGVTMFAEGDFAAARDLLDQGIALARRVGDRDVESLARIFQGHVLVNIGEERAGLAMVDEATAAAMGGGLGLQTAGSIYCSTIFLCRNRGDWRRAGEWTEASLRWCERESVSGFPGLCRFHRAEVMRFRGALEEAERDALEARDELTASAPRWAAYAHHELGEVRRRRGNPAGAAEAFAQAAELGLDPQPGLALMHLDEGDVQAAQRAVRRALADETGLAHEAQALVLPAAVTIELAAGDLEAAASAVAQLEARAEQSGSAAFAAAAAGARGEIALAEGRTDDAARELRRAWQAWREVEAPFESASARVLLAQAYRAQGSDADATLELETARTTFERLGAPAEAERVDALLARPVAEVRAIRTFMFTDIVDSTKLVEAVGDGAWDGLLAWHDRTLRACFEAHGGDEVKHEGDGFFVAFPDAGSAIEGACAIQRSLAAHRRDHGFAPRVRIGLHTAEATEKKGDYAGKGVHAAARVAAAAVGDEVLVSRDALDAAGEEIAVTDERALELKGFAQPVTVASVSWQ